ncbi:MAG TPA: hypothetical protein VFZ00_11305 [Solirubrobacter sp.]|nr:hypothetical protein [Solirubrobacter sp.]
MSGTQPAIARTIADADKVSLKRLAWAFGCAPKGSSEEMQLEMLLLARAEPELNELTASWASVAVEMLAENSALSARIAELERRLGDVGGNERA